ncbi:MAG TPA: hypothetical protein ENI76_09035 [Ignavibacteria bacterium]|nr:hypothetical protein [Ignavibacteria bacterium]
MYKDLEIDQKIGVQFVAGNTNAAVEGVFLGYVDDPGRILIRVETGIVHVSTHPGIIVSILEISNIVTTGNISPIKRDN